MLIPIAIPIPILLLIPIKIVILIPIPVTPQKRKNVTPSYKICFPHPLPNAGETYWGTKTYRRGQIYSQGVMNNDWADRKSNIL